MSGTLHARELKQESRVVIKLLQVVRALIHNEHQLTSEFTGVTHDVTAMQNVLADQGIALAIAGMLHHPNDEVVRESLACLVQLLDGGNKRVQDSFSAHFRLRKDENFFDDIMSRMRRAEESLREQRTLYREITQEKAREEDLIKTMTRVETLGGQNTVGNGKTTLSLAIPDDEEVEENDNAKYLRVENAVGYGYVALFFGFSVFRFD